MNSLSKFKKNDKQTNRKTAKRIDKQTNRKTAKRIDKQTIERKEKKNVLKQQGEKKFLLF
jgi:hypothetical protein